MKTAWGYHAAPRSSLHPISLSETTCPAFRHFCFHLSTVVNRCRQWTAGTDAERKGRNCSLFVCLFCLLGVFLGGGVTSTCCWHHTLLCGRSRHSSPSLSLHVDPKHMYVLVLFSISGDVLVPEEENAPQCCATFLLFDVICFPHATQFILTVQYNRNSSLILIYRPCCTSFRLSPLTP